MNHFQKAPTPSKHYIANAIPVEGGFTAQFSAPGLIPHLVTLPQRQTPVVFATAEAARAAAREALFGILNSPRRTQARGKNSKVSKLSGPEAAVLIAEAGLTLTFCAFLAGTSVDRVQSWVDGLDFMPHPVRLLLEIFKANPKMVDLAEDITERSSEPR